MTTITSKTLQVNGLSLHYLEAGEGPPLLCLHGWPTNAQLWRNIMPKLARHRRVIALDLPGFGQSDKPLDVRYSLRFFDEVLDGFCQELGVEKLGLAVHDLGGPVGLHWAAGRRERISELFLLNTLIFSELSWMVVVFLAGLKTPGLRDLFVTPYAVAEAIRFGVSQRANITPEVAAIYSTPYQPKPARKALIKAGSELSPKGFKKIEAAFEKWDIPICIVYGEGDRILPDVGKTMARVKAQLPHARLTSLPNCGHFLQEDEPERVAQIMSEFIEATAVLERSPDWVFQRAILPPSWNNAPY